MAESSPSCVSISTIIEITHDLGRGERANLWPPEASGCRCARTRRSYIRLVVVVARTGAVQAFPCAVYGWRESSRDILIKKLALCVEASA